MSWLLDVNVLVALFWPNHTHHGAALKWFLAHRSQGWATCTLTELSFLRISMSAAAAKNALTFTDAQRLLQANISTPLHEFWPLDYSPAAMLPEIQQRIRGRQQVPDALLLDLAIRHNAKLATFDRGIVHLMPERSAHLRAVETIASP